jgi:CBS domain containing-hemolysin-like protein
VTFLHLEMIVIGLSLAFLLYLALVEGAIGQASRLTMRMLLEKTEGEPPPLLPLLLEDKMQLLVPLHLGIQFSLITIAILVTHLSLVTWPDWGVLWAFAIIFFISIVFRQLLPRLLTQNEPEKKLKKFLRLFNPVYRMLRPVALPLSGTLLLFRKLHEEAGSTANPVEEETSEEEIQAYLDIGEDEGIIEKEDSKLIQSVVEFGDTSVREVMTPRTKIVACEESATLGELREIMVKHRHSRIPIYREDMDHIIGIAYIRQLLAHTLEGKDSDPITGLIHPALFVPDTKPVSALLKELQERGDHTAIAIDEFGGVAGLVTMEDILEEIVGEIRDEDQAKVSEIVEEAPRVYIFRASTELYRLEELAEKKFEGSESATVGGLIMSYLGRVPAPGEEFDLEGLHVQVLDADRKRVHRLRIQLPPEMTNAE